MNSKWWGDSRTLFWAGVLLVLWLVQALHPVMGDGPYFKALAFFAIGQMGVMRLITKVPLRVELEEGEQG